MLVVTPTVYHLWQYVPCKFHSNRSPVRKEKFFSSPPGMLRLQRVHYSHCKFKSKQQRLLDLPHISLQQAAVLWAAPEQTVYFLRWSMVRPYLWPWANCRPYWSTRSRSAIPVIEFGAVSAQLQHKNLADECKSKTISATYLTKSLEFHSF